VNVLGNLEERARHRGGMGRSSGGAFDAGIASAHSSSGRAEPFAQDVSDQPRRRTMDDPPSYYDSYWDRSYPNNQRSWSTEQDQRRREGMQAGYGFFAVLAFFSLFRKHYSFSIFLYAIFHERLACSVCRNCGLPFLQRYILRWSLFFQ